MKVIRKSVAYNETGDHLRVMQQSGTEELQIEIKNMDGRVTVFVMTEKEWLDFVSGVGIIDYDADA